MTPVIQLQGSPGQPVGRERGDDREQSRSHEKGSQAGPEPRAAERDPEVAVDDALPA